MADRETIFRPEALEHRVREKGPGDVVRIAPRWTAWAFYVLVGLFVLSVIAASLIEIDRYATGTTTSEDGMVVVLLPAALAPEVEIGQPVELGEETAQVTQFRESVLDPSEAQERYGIALTVPSVAVVTSAESDQATPPSARVLVESEPIIVALIPGLESLFGGN